MNVNKINNFNIIYNSNTYNYPMAKDEKTFKKK